VTGPAASRDRPGRAVVRSRGRPGRHFYLILLRLVDLKLVPPLGVARYMKDEIAPLDFTGLATSLTCFDLAPVCTRVEVIIAGYVPSVHVPVHL